MKWLREHWFLFAALGSFVSVLGAHELAQERSITALQTSDGNTQRTLDRIDQNVRDIHQLLLNRP